jgi:hypothetical protein
MKAQTGPHAVSLPILIDALPTRWMRKGDAEGEALMLAPMGDAVLLRLPISHPVRRFKDTDFRRAQELMGEGGTMRFVALRLLQTAIASKQPEDIKSAREKLCAAAASDHQLMERLDQLLKASSGRASTGKRSKKMASIYPEGSMMDEVYRNFHPGDLADQTKKVPTRYLTEDAVRLFATETTTALMGVQLVLWRSGTRLMPALYCDNHVTAAYATALFGRRWKVCPHSRCGKWFVPTRAKQDFCCPAHREAHRVARWRERHKVRPNQP